MCQLRCAWRFLPGTAGSRKLRTLRRQHAAIRGSSQRHEQKCMPLQERCIRLYGSTHSILRVDCLHGHFASIASACFYEDIVSFVAVQITTPPAPNLERSTHRICNSKILPRLRFVCFFRSFVMCLQPKFFMRLCDRIVKLVPRAEPAPES